MSMHDDLLEMRMQLVAVIDASDNKSLACAQAGIHRSNYYRWKKFIDEPAEHPLAGVSYLERQIAQQVVAVSLAFPGLGPRPVRDRVGDLGFDVSISKVWRTLVKENLNTREKRYELLKQHKTPPTIVERGVYSKPFVGSLDAELPGDLVQMDCFLVGSYKESRIGQTKHAKGRIWQYTAIDVASSFLFAEAHLSAHNPTPQLASQFAHRVAGQMRDKGWPIKQLSTDNGNEFRAQQFRDMLVGLGIDHRFIKAGRPQSNGKVEGVQGIMLEEFYKPNLINYVEPSMTGLRIDMAQYVEFYNYKRRHYGKWNQGRTPNEVIITPKAKLLP